MGVLNSGNEQIQYFRIRIEMLAQLAWNKTGEMADFPVEMRLVKEMKSVSDLSHAFVRLPPHVINRLPNAMNAVDAFGGQSDFFRKQLLNPPS